MQIQLVFALLFALAVAGFAVQNAEPMTVHFLHWQARTSQVVVILGAAALGALSAGLAGAYRWVKTGWQVRQMKAQTQKLEQEVHDLRAERDDLRTEVHTLRRRLDDLQRAQGGGTGVSPHPPSSHPT